MNYRQEYVNFLKEFFHPVSPVVIVADCSNGSVGPVLEIFEDKNLHLNLINQKPDGDFPAHGPNPQLFDSLKGSAELIQRMHADFGAVFDGDGDRIIFLDDQGEKLPEDEIVFILGKRFKGPFVFDVRIGQIAQSFKHFRSKVGHIFVKKLMASKKASFGGEVSGHYYFKFKFGKEYSYYDSALRAFVEFANCVSEIKSEGKTLSEFRKSIPQFFRSGEINFKVRNHSKVLETLASEYKKKGGEISKVDGVSVWFPEKKWWFNARLSNTEPLLRLNMESADPKILKEEMAYLNKRIPQIDKS